MEHIVVHKDGEYHSAFPHIVRLQDGDLVVAFRQSPIREEMVHRHLDPESRIVLVRSSDDGKTWDPDSRVIIDASDGAHDINMVRITQLSSGELIANNHRWVVIPEGDEARLEGLEGRRRVLFRSQPPYGTVAYDTLMFMRSYDQGRTWSAPVPVGISSFAYVTHTGYNEMIEMPDGTLLAPFHGRCAADEQDRFFVARSRDGGRTWAEPSTVAHDPEGRISFHEPPLLRLPDGKLLSVIRTAGADGYLYQAFSTNDGWTWQGLKRTPIWGHPSHLLRLQSGRILCAYGYRREAFGVRAVFSEDEGQTWDMDHEIVIRADGLHRDLGYPTSVQLEEGRILVVYYFHGEDGIRYIGGSIFEE